MTDKPKPKAELPKWATRGPLALLAVGTVFYFIIAVGLPDERKAFWGQAGDSVAPFAVLFNAFALLAVVYSMKLQLDSLGEQRRSLALQRKELRLQRKELALQTGRARGEPRSDERAARAVRENGESAGGSRGVSGAAC